MLLKRLRAATVATAAVSAAVIAAPLCSPGDAAGAPSWTSQLNSEGLEPLEAADPSVLKAFHVLGDRFVGRWLDATDHHTPLVGVYHLTSDEVTSLPVQVDASAVVNRDVSRPQLNAAAGEVEDAATGLPITAIAGDYYRAAIEVMVPNEAIRQSLIERLASNPHIVILPTETVIPDDGEIAYSQADLPRVAVSVGTVTPINARRNSLELRTPPIRIRLEGADTHSVLTVSTGTNTTAPLRSGTVLVRWRHDGVSGAAGALIRAADHGRTTLVLPPIKRPWIVELIARHTGGPLYARTSRRTS